MARRLVRDGNINFIYNLMIVRDRHSTLQILQNKTKVSVVKIKIN